MKIALLLESDGPGGAETVLLTMAKSLRERGHQIVPVGPKEGEGWLGERFREAGFEPAFFELRRALDIRCVMDLKALMQRRGVDVMHSHEFTMAVYGAAAARLAGVPHVITMHGGRYYAGALRRRVAFRWAIRNSARTVAVSGFTARDLETSLGLAEGSLHVIPNGLRITRGDRANVREELGLSATDLLVLTVGNLYLVKGQDVLVRAVARVLKEDPSLPVYLAVAGRGEQEPVLRSLARENGIIDRVHFLGFRDDVPDLLAAADVFALPSRSEGLPLALLEAMFAGRPVIASAVGGIPEVVRHNQEALLCEPDSPDDLASALSSLLREPDLRERLGTAGRDLAKQRYSPEAMVSAYETVYRSGLKRTSQST